MKKLFFMAVAAIAALSSCTSDNELELNQNTGKEALTFTATMEDSEATRATLGTDEDGKNYAVWEAGDQISIDGKTYSAQAAGTTSTFKADGEGATGTPYKAYFPADLFDGTTATLPAIQTYEAGKFNMPMYATSTTTELQFYNLCAVLAIKVTSADIATLKSIKVASDKKMNGTFTVSDNAAVINDEEGTNVVVLESSEALTLTADGTTFYIAIPAQEYNYLNIFLSADGETYTQAMATKKKDGLGTIARSKIFNIDYAKNATKLWEGNLFFADCNIGATSPEGYGEYYQWADNIASNAWGSNWRMPTKAELEEFGSLSTKCECSFKEIGNVSGLKYTGKGDYESNYIFLPAASSPNYSGLGNLGFYWSSTLHSENNDKAWHLYFDRRGVITNYVDTDSRTQKFSVRAVLEEAASPAPAAEYPAGSRGTAKRYVDIDVNWVQLWENGPKFAEYNIGATSATDYGGYYTWGGNYANGEGITWNGDYNKGADALSGDNDTATNLWGSAWRMPTKAEFEGLLDNCTVEWIDGSNKKYNNTTATGLLCTGKDAYSSNSVFLPAAGYFCDNKVVDPGKYVRYLSSTPYNNNAAYLLRCDSNVQSVNSVLRDRGYSVRAVLNE